jgi:hypothetical protein
LIAKKGRPGPGGTRIYARKPRGRTARVPATKAEAAAARVAALKHGGRAQVVSVREARGLAVEKIFGRGSKEVFDQYAAAITDGDSSGIEVLAIGGLTDLELIRRDMVSKVAKQGAVLKESIVSPLTGEIVGERIKLHPAVEGVARFSELLGHTSAARRLDPKSKGEGDRDEAAAAYLKRDQFLRGYQGRNSMAPPPDDVVDAEVVPVPALPGAEK